MRVALDRTPYDIAIGPGLLGNLRPLLEAHCPAATYAVVSDSSVAQLYGQQVLDALAGGPPAFSAVFAAGEWNKTRETWNALTDQVIAGGLGRDGAILALGGGVVGDLAGFVAASLYRGVPFVQLPTTLLAMIDSSIGGKTGVDTPMGKNLVGAFHQPALVVADTDTLTSLPPLHVGAGLAEALKHGAIADAGYFGQIRDRAADLLAGSPDLRLEAVRRSVEIKAGIVAEDEREHGSRARLNFGHTVGHAMEAVTGYQTLHGEAVALGMVAEAVLGERLGVTVPGVADTIRDAIERCGLPSAMPPDVDTGAIIVAMGRDKKVREGTVRFALLEKIGQSAREASGGWTVAAPLDLVREVVDKMSR